VTDIVEQLEYAACGQGPDAEQTLYWKARNEIIALRKRVRLTPSEVTRLIEDFTAKKIAEGPEACKAHLVSIGAWPEN